MGFLDDIFGSNKTTNTSYNKNTASQFAGQSNQQQSYNPYGAPYSQYALQQGQPGILGAQGFAQPYYDQSANYFGQSGQLPDVASFYNPFAGSVMGNLQDIFGQQMKQTTGSLAQQAGGVGADRIAVGQSELAKQQGLAAGQTMAGIYGQAQQAAAQQRAQQYQTGQGYAGLGTAAQMAQLQPWLALGQYTQGLTPGMGAAQTAAASQYGSQTGQESGTGTQTTQSNPSMWSDIGNIAGTAGMFLNRGGAVSPFAKPRGWHDSAGQGAHALMGLHPFNPRTYMRGGPGYAGGGDVDSFADRFGAADDAVASGQFDPQFENGSHWADEPGGAMAFAPEDTPTPRSRPDTADVPTQDDAGPSVESPPMVPWQPAPREGESNPYATGPQQDRSGLGGFLASRGIISPETADTMGGFGKRLTRAGLFMTGHGPEAARLPLEERALDQRQMSLEQGMRRLELMHEQAVQQMAETGRHNRATEQHGTESLDIQRQRYTGGLFDPETTNMMAEQALTGDKSVFANLGRGVSGPQNIVQVRQRMNELMRQRGYSGADIAAANANFGAQTKAAGSQAVRESNVASAIEEAKNTFPLALKASEALPRTEYVPWNQLVQAVRQKTASPAQARFEVAVQGAITAYSQAMSRTGTNTVNAQQHAELLLNKATSHDAFKAAIDQMDLEMEAARAAPETVRKRILSHISGREEGAPPPPTPGKGASAPGFTGRTATDPKTGHKLRETSDGNWVE